MKEQLISLAREAGFAEVAFTSPHRITQSTPLHPQAAIMTGDTASPLPGAKCVMLMAMPYRPIRYEGNEAQVDAYYLTSNKAHEAANLLAKRIEETLSIRALASPPVYLKPLAVCSGLGEFGRNSLISVGAYGTRTALQAILLDVEIEQTAYPMRAFSSLCKDCRACVNACPTQALPGDGSLDLSRCLRAQPEGEVFPEHLRVQLGAGILGCDICQRVCRRNESVPETSAPDDLSDALNLRALLEGKYQPLIPFLGKNNARRQRLTARALIAAANLGRTDLLPLVEELTGCQESDAVKEHAEWALKRLKSL